MDADLVRSPRVETRFEERHAIEALEDSEVSPRVSVRVWAVLGVDGHPLAVGRVAADWGVDGRGLETGVAPDQRQIASLDGSRGDLRLEGAHRNLAAGDDHHAGSILVEAVDDTGSEGGCLVIVGGQLGAGMAEDGVDEGPRSVSRRRMDDEAAGFVDHEEVLVFVGDVQGDRFGFWGGLRRGWRSHLTADDLAGAELLAGAGGLAVDGCGAVVDQLLERGTREVGEMRLQRAVEALADSAVINDEFDPASGIHDVAFPT